MSMKYIISLLNKLRDEWYTPPINYHQKKIEFEYRSYRRSAMDEIKMYLMEHEDKDPISIIEDFRYKMDCFACETKNGNANFMFSIYYDVATDALDVLLGMK